MVMIALLLVMSVCAAPNSGTDQTQVSTQRSDSQTEVAGKTDRSDVEMTAANHGIQENESFPEDQSEGMENKLRHSRVQSPGQKDVIETHSFVTFWSERDTLGRGEIQDTISAYQEFFARSVIKEEDNGFPEGSGTGAGPLQNCSDCSGPVDPDNASPTQRPSVQDEEAQSIRDSGHKLGPNVNRRTSHPRNTRHKRSPPDSASNCENDSDQEPPVHESGDATAPDVVDNNNMDLLNGDSESPERTRRDMGTSELEGDVDPETRALFGFWYPGKHPYFYYVHGR